MCTRAYVVVAKDVSCSICRVRYEHVVLLVHGRMPAQQREMGGWLRRIVFPLPPITSAALVFILAT